MNTIMMLDERLRLANKFGLTTQVSFEQLLNELATIRVNKVVSYGERRYHDRDLDPVMNMLLLYGDIYRKYIRLEKFMNRLRQAESLPTNIEAQDRESLRECFLDMANYCLMGIQIMDILIPQSQPEGS